MKNLEAELEAIREICKEQNFSEEELLNRARLLYFINRLDFARELPILLDLIQYEVAKKLKLPSDDEIDKKMREIEVRKEITLKQMDYFLEGAKWMRSLAVTPINTNPNSH